MNQHRVSRGLKLVTEFVQDENATQDDYTALERKLSELKAIFLQFE